jgi:hypothetical protein
MPCARRHRSEQAVFLATLRVCLFRTKHFCSSQGQN